jgi:aminoglycoside phosphotransferase family enzyme/predicted kinase
VVDPAAQPAAAEPLDPELVAGMAQEEAYPDDPGARAGIEHLQTHLSHVFLSGERVYKLRKAARFDFVDFGSRAERSADCLREVALNRRLAPAVYLGVAAVRRTPVGVRVDPPGESLIPDAEHCVVMRRLPAGRDALSGIERGWFGAAQIDAVAQLVADFHSRHGLGAPAPFAPEQWRERLEAPVRECFRVIGAAGLDAATAELGRETERRARAFMAAHGARFEARRSAGLVVDGHGDLHLQHVWFEADDAAPIAIDCLEFRDDYRQIDRASEVAFLAMDLAYRERSDLAERFLRVYAALTDDFGLYGVVDYFLCYRAAVRAKVAALAARDPAIPDRQREQALASASGHLELAASALAARPRGALIALCGIVGTGKSSVAAELAERLRGVVISSDRVRKKQAGLEPTDRSGSGPGASLYTPERTREVYAGICERSLAVVDSGRPALLDATYASAELRADLRRFAQRHGLRAVLVETHAEPGMVLERLRRRAEQGRDPSDAGPEFYAQSASHYQPPDEWPAGERFRVQTDRADRGTRLDEIAGLVLRAGDR